MVSSLSPNRYVSKVVRDDHTLLSTESIVSPSSSAGVVEPCAACGAPLADDQRYCLECGERRTPMRSVLLGGPPSGEQPQSQVPATAPPPQSSTAAEDAGRGNAVTVIAGVGVLLLAMGVGVLIGRSSAPKQSAAPAQTISVTQPAAGAGAGAGAVGTSTPTAPEAASKAGSSASKGAAKGAAGAAGSKSGVGASESHPAPPTVLKNLATKKGKNYEQESKNLPNVISTG
jgi:hypothetical protein